MKILLTVFGCELDGPARGPGGPPYVVPQDLAQ